MSVRPVTGEAMTLTAGVSRRLPGGIDCAIDECSIAVFNNSNGARLASKRIKFDPDAPLFGPVTIAVAPSTGLADRQDVTLSISGLIAAGSVEQCVIGATGRPGTECVPLGHTTDLDRHSFTEIDVRVRRTVGDHDCAVEAESCALVLRYQKNDGPFGGEARQKYKLLTFDSAATPFPGPTLLVTPALGLADGDVVTVAGSRFAPKGRAFIGLCDELDEAIDLADGDWFRNCSTTAGARSPIDSDGAFSVEVALAAQIRSNAGEVVECEEQCVLIVTDGIDLVTASVRFDRSRPAATTAVAGGLSWPETLGN